MKLKKMYLTTALIGVGFTLSISQSSFAANPGESHKDSVQEWGPWGSAVTPAAGPVVTAGQGVPQFNLAAVQPPEQPLDPEQNPPDNNPPQVSICPDGSLCGYSALKYATGDGNVVTAGALFDAEHPGEVLLYLEPTGDPDSTGITPPDVMYSNTPNGILRIINTFLDDANALADDSGPQPAEFYVSDPSGRITDVNYSSNTAGGMMVYVRLNEILDGTTSVHTGMVYVSDFATGKTFSGPFAVGDPTPLSDLENLAAGNAVGIYSGYTLGGFAPVQITVDFAGATWSGSWNNGMDTPNSIGRFQATDGNEYLHGLVGFNASGTVDGQIIKSNSISAVDAQSISGWVQGTIMGNGADSIVGASDITKTSVRRGGYIEARNVDAFVVSQEGVVPQNK